MSTLKEDALFLYLRIRGKSKVRAIQMIEEALKQAKDPYLEEDA